MLLKETRPPVRTDTERSYELKFDGYRLLAYVGAEGVFLKTRNGADATKWFGEIADALRALQGQQPGPSVFVDPLRAGAQRRMTLLKLGLAYAVGSIAIIWLSDIADGGKFEALQVAMASGKDDAEAIAALLADPQLQFGLMLRFGLASLLSLPFWHAPALVHWGDHGVGKALFFSTLACWRNLGAFVVYGLAWAGVILLFGVLANLLASVLQQAQLIAVAAVPAGLLLSTVFYASLYFTFSDCFAPDETEPGAS